MMQWFDVNEEDFVGVKSEDIHTLQSNMYALHQFFPKNSFILEKLSLRQNSVT
jgi:hypothetical protein